MALNHINSDLTHALRRNGIGDDKVWRCVGDVVEQCERDLLEGDVDLQVVGGITKGIDENYDVQKLRDAMRERVRRRLDEQGFDENERQKLRDSMRERVRRMREEQCGPRSRCR